MHRPRKNANPLLLILFVIFSFTPINSCGFGGGRLKKPKGIISCVLDAPALEGICIEVGTLDDPERKPISELDKSMMFPLKSWEKYKNWIDKLEAKARQK